MILTADIGTTNLKTGLFSDKGALYATATVKLPVCSDSLDPEIWAGAFSECCRALECQSKTINAVIITGNGPTLVPSEHGDALLWTHSADEQSRRIREELGLNLGPTMFLPKALFIKENLPDIYSSNSYFMSSPEYLSYRLTSQPSTMMPLEGLEKWYWDDSSLERLGLDRSKFPPFVRMGVLLGKVTRKAASFFHLKTGTPVLSGCPDFVAAIIGSGAMKAGMLCDRSGTGEGLNYCSRTKVENPLYMSYRHPNSTDWNVSYVIPKTGRLIDSIKKPDMSYSDFFNTVEGHDTCLKICTDIRDAIAMIATDTVSEVRLIGGPSKSASFNQMRADVTKIPHVTLESPESGLTGLAATAIAYLENKPVSEVAQRIVRIRDVYLPQIR